MSKPNKVNKGNYDQGGRLTSDELARERVNQGEQTESNAAQASRGTGRATAKDNVIGKGRWPAAAPASTPARSEREEEE
jgi:hypothetical protein